MPEPGRKAAGGSVTDALRVAIERTLDVAGRPARMGSAALPRERATQLLDEVARRGREAQAALGRRGKGGGEDLVRRLESLEQRLTRLEDRVLRSEPERED